MNRVKHTLGGFGINPGTPGAAGYKQDSQKYQIAKHRKYYMFAVTPCPAPRMTQSDKWRTENHPDPKKRRRPVVSKYFAFRDSVRLQAAAMKFTQGDTFEAVFFVPMPESWSAKKKERMNGAPCMVRPDCDNYTKAFLDAMKREDGSVWHQNCQKRYSYSGAILVYHT